MKIQAKPQALLRALLLMLMLSYTNQALAYDVERPSVGNTIYLLLSNEAPGAVIHSVTVSDDSPSFIANIAPTIIPATIAGGTSDLVVVTFDVTLAIIGLTDDIVLTLSGFAAGNPISLDVTIPLTVVESASEAQGLVGSTIPAPDPGGVDTDGDGITDALELAFGSDPLSSTSTPGNPNVEPTVVFTVPALPAFGSLILVGLLSALGIFFKNKQIKSNRRAGERS